MTSFLKMGALAAALVSAQLTATAADLDLFTGGPGANASDLPNVLFVIDNTANWNSAFVYEMEALKNTLRNMPANKYNVGIMLGTETGGNNGGPQGGYVRAAMRPMDAANKFRYEELIQSFDKYLDKGSAGTSALQLAEAWAYFSGGKPYAGNLKTKTDYTGNAAGSPTDVAIHAMAGNALVSYGSTQYLAPVGASGCAGTQNYIIYISNGPNQSNSADNALSNQMLAAAGGSTAKIPLAPSSSESNPADEWTRFMKQSRLRVVTYTLDVNPSNTGAGPGWTALLKSMSGLSNYQRVTSGNGSVEIQHAINQALAKILSVNSVFAPVSLPASPNVQDAYLNQLYIGIFRPDMNAKPRWMGNLKQYQAGPSSTLVDMEGVDLIDTGTGFISACAISAWTPAHSMPDNYWAPDPQGACIAPGADPLLYASSNTPDGNITEKGAQAYKLRTQDPNARRVMTCATPACAGLVDMNTATVSAAALGAADASEHAALINWAKGANVDSELNRSPLEMRPSAHGDVIHSTPLALSYGNDVVVYYGGNDGMLRAINGNHTLSFNGVTAGNELWAFMPPEFVGKLKRLRTNTETVRMAAPLGLSSTGSSKPYAFDGPITAFKGVVSGWPFFGDTWMFATMRRGGRAVYAFDVSDKMAPALKWKAGCAGADDSACTPGASELGQTWSAPVAVRTMGYVNGAVPLLMMGGGYDNCEDADQHSCTSLSKGHNIAVLDADSGAVVKVLNTERGVVGDVRIVLDANGLGKYAYAADLGGNLYRIDMGAVAPQNWHLTKVAALGCATADMACRSNRKFMFAPSVIEEADGSISLYLGSGDREKPLGSLYYQYTSGVANYFFKVIDKPEDPTWLTSEAWSNCGGQALICLDSLSPAGSTDENMMSPCGGAQSDKKGWYLALRPTEQVVTRAATRFGVTTFSTHMPAVYQPGSCTSNLGTAHVYNLDVGTAAPVRGTCSDVVTGGGLPPSPQKLDVCMDAACSLKQPVCIGCGTDSPLQMQPSEAPVVPEAQRQANWYLK